MPPLIRFGLAEGQQEVEDGKYDNDALEEDPHNFHMENVQGKIEPPVTIKPSYERTHGQNSPKCANSEACEDAPKGTGRSRSSSTFGALQKWLQMSTESLAGGSHGQSTSSTGGKSSQSMLQASKSFVKDGINALSSSS